MMKRYSAIAMCGALAACSSTDSADNFRSSSELLVVTDEGHDEEEELQRQTSEQAAAEDLQLVAEANGWTIDQAAAQRLAADVVGSIAETVFNERRDIFIGSALSKDPGGVPTLFIKGTTDDWLRKLVASAPIEIKISDGHPFSSDEMHERKLLVHRALHEAGYQNFSSWAELERGDIVRVLITRQRGMPEESNEILELVPEFLRASTEIAITDDPNANSDDTSFGGMLLNTCTAGWSVLSEIFTTGVSTAGHCGNQTTIAHPGVGTHTTTFQWEHRGSWGDVEWYQTNVAEPATFYSDDTTIRNTTAVESIGNVTVGETVCLYSRLQGVRDCSLEVNDTDVSCTVSGVFNDRLVNMNGDVAIGGDSGAGWSYNNTAFGGHKGNCGGGNAWTAAYHFYDALTVVVATQ